MSEVQDACQIILVAGKGAYWVGRIQMKLALSLLKLMNTIYLAKWEGKVGLNRFRNIKGDNYLFVNVNSEDGRALKEVEKELKEHGILFARMPDLCGGDGRTQYVISPSDAAKFRSFLIDHNKGKTRRIRVGTINAEDYMQSGYDEQGRETPEMKELNHSAAEEIRKMQSQEPEKQRTESRIQPPEKQQTESRVHPHRKIRAVKSEKEEKDAEIIDEDLENRPSLKTVQYHCIRHDEMVAESGDIAWIYDPPMEKQDDWCMFEMRDGRHAVIIPESEHYTLTSGSGPKYRTAIYDGREYIVVDMETGEMQKMKGADVSAQMRKPDIRTINFQLKNRYRNTSNGKEWQPKRATDFRKKAAERQHDSGRPQRIAAETNRSR